MEGDRPDFTEAGAGQRTSGSPLSASERARGPGEQVGASNAPIDTTDLAPPTALAAPTAEEKPQRPFQINRRAVVVAAGSLAAGSGLLLLAQQTHLLTEAHSAFLQLAGKSAADATSTAQAKALTNPLTLVGDLTLDRRTISPDIYGVALAPDAYLKGSSTLADAKAMGVRVGRWGGNNATRYNWKLGNAWNAARDYLFANGSYDHDTEADSTPSGVADQWITAVRGAGIGSLLTIPTMGWVAKDANLNTRSLKTPSGGGPPLVRGGEAIAGYDPTANRNRTSVPSRARKGGVLQDPPDLSDHTVAQDEWVYHLTRRFGQATSGGVRYYEMDNEPDLWSITHTDVHPAQQTYEQMRDNFLDYANAVKDVDPNARIVGLDLWNWFSLFTSPIDAGTNYHYDNRVDYHAHGDQPFMEWWLDQVRQDDQARGRRSLDVLSFHVYPQGGEYSDDVTAAMQAQRLRSTRILWDRDYVAESWIKDKMAMIPRMRDWVAQHYPGTKLGITEYSWGATESVNGALAQALVLGVFAREGLSLACHWGTFAAGSPAHSAFKLFANYDTHGSGFTGTAFRLTSSNDELLTGYGAQSGQGRAVLLMVVNKSAESDLTPTIQLRGVSAQLGGAPLRRGKVWRYWPEDGAGVTQGADFSLNTQGSPQTLTYTFPASSLTLLRLEADT